MLSYLHIVVMSALKTKEKKHSVKLKRKEKKKKFNVESIINFSEESGICLEAVQMYYFSGFKDFYSWFLCRSA